MTDTAVAPRRPGPARSLSRERVVAVGLEIMASDGLKSVSFRSVANRLGVDPKALYTYVHDKDDLLAGMYDAAVGDLALPRPGDPRPPVEQLVDLLTSMRAAFLANADLLHLASPKVDVDTAWSGSQPIWAALIAVTGDADRAAELYTNLIQLAIGSALQTARNRASEPRAQAVLASLDGASPSEMVEMAQAMRRVDPDLAFESLVRTLVELAGASR